VGRSGIEDALRVAEDIHAMSRVATAVLDMRPAAHVELPHELARALGAVIAEPGDSHEEEPNDARR
jgi:hypothetical protein